METFSVTKKIKKNPSIKVPLFLSMKNKVLGKKYNLSVVFVSLALSKKLNFKYRKINKPTDILSFPVSKDEGEIFINLECARKKAKVFERDEINYLYFLFIHGLVHLKGFEHGSRMERKEKKFRKFFGI
jgi:probable rRNA maturation factor